MSEPLPKQPVSSPTPPAPDSGGNGVLPLWHPDAPRPQVLTEVLQNLTRFQVPLERQELVVRAFRYAAEKHRFHVRKDDETPYIYHPLEVARIISEYIGDPEMLAAALLHDTLEDCKDQGVTHEDLVSRFNPDVAQMVDGVTKLSKIEGQDATIRQAENTRKMLYAVAKDVRVLLIKLADRLHNMRTLDSLTEPRKLAIAQETLDFYAPMAHQLGMHRLKSELEDLAFKYLEPEGYRELSEQVVLKRGERERIIGEAVAAVQAVLDQKGIKATVKGRAKHLYSIHQKMIRDELTFDQLYDLFALRITLDANDEGECYKVLGIIHSIWNPIYEKFKDYIARPKSNGYKSLHAVVFGPEGRPLEVQIRTRAMDQRAEWGVAAHYLYKEDRKAFTDTEERLAWVRRLQEWEEEDQPDPQRYMEGLKTELIPGEVVVYTPKGDIKVLPVGATPIDFAFSVHTNVGYATRQARVNGRLVPLNYELQSGDIVEVLTKKGAVAPSRHWLEFVRSNRAKSKIEQYFRKLDYDTKVKSGRSELLKEERRMGLHPQGLTNEVNLKASLSALGFKKLDDLYAAIGSGEPTARQVMRVLRDRRIKQLKTHSAAQTRAAALSDRVPLEGTAAAFGLRIENLDDVTVHLAQCCLPVHGDEVVAYVTKGRGLAVHRTACKTLLTHLDKEAEEGARAIPATWSEKSPTVFLGTIDLWVLDRVGLLSEVTSAVAELKVNVLGVKIGLGKDKTARMRIRVQVRDAAELNKVLLRLRENEDVLEARRGTGK